MEFNELINIRHSVRSYSKEPVATETLNAIIAQAELAPTSRNKKPCRFYAVTDRELLNKMSQAKAGGSQFLDEAGAAIVCAADSSISDVWIEDASIAMTYLHLAATDMGLGSCWIQLRKRKSAQGEDSDAYVKKLLNLEENIQVLAVLAVGNKQ